MPELSELIREYGGLLVQESLISERKQRLRKAIAGEMARKKLKATTTEHGRVSRTTRVKIVIKRPPGAIRWNEAPSNGRPVTHGGEDLAPIPG